ncbi:protein PYRICULARIA ORYZAE RESISTANCE 21-like isoform X2 [Vitis riparia]|nr:protein PYRICULARIA ORYZAE RESISTANCE 21-like isoform X2 [Vitis riparia]
MKLKVANLGCKRCYKKIKKLLCKFPEIRDQTFSEKDDTVIIEVVCCCPEKIRTKLICKGGDTIKSIEVIPTENPPEPAPKPALKPAPKPEPAPKPAPAPKPEPAPKPAPAPPIPGYLAFIYPIGVYPIGVCCKSCYEGRGGGPCHHRYGIPHQPPSHDGWPSGCRCDRSYGCRCEIVIEENPTCTIV